MPILEPLQTIQGITSAIRQDEKLRYDPSLIKTWQSLGGALTNNSIPLPYKEDIPAGYTKTSEGVYQPTVITSAKIIEDKIPDLKSKVKDMSETGTYTDNQGITRTADGVPVQEKNEDETYLKNLADFNRKFGRQTNDTTGIKKVAGGGIDTSGVYDEQGNVIGGTRQPTPQEEELDAIYNQRQNLIDQMKATLDAQTKRQIDSIEAQLAIRKQQQTEIDRRQKEGIQQSLLMGGSSRYAQLSSAGIIATKDNASLMNIAQLDAQEKELINAALAAQESGDYKLLEKKLDLAETKRKEKTAETEKLSKAIAEENKRLKEEKEKLDEAQRMQAIGDFVSDSLYSGITDINEIYRQARISGMAINTEEINKALKNLYVEKKEEKPENHLENLSIDFRDFDYLSNLPNRGGLPESIKTPIQYIKYKKQLEQDIKNNAKQPTPRGTPTEIDISDLSQIDKLPVSDLTKAAIGGFIKIKELTPSDKSKVASELFKIGFNPNQYVIKKLEGLVAMYANMPETQRGLFEGFLKPWAKHTDKTVATFESAKAVLTREIARLNDVGVLSDQDVATYNSAMPSRMDSDIAIVLGKISGLAQTITGQSANENAGKIIELEDGREAIVGFDGETLLDPQTGKEIQ